MLTEKICTKCKEMKPATAFGKRPSATITGLSSWCRKCTSARINKMAPFRRKQRKLEAIKIMGGKCCRCHGVFPHYVYDFHHIDPSRKEFSMTDLQDKAWHRLEKELNKCILVCANCHRIEHHSKQERKP
jgi:hypothetical protein